ncbi:hypothetical protein YW7DRAFT_03740 [Streptomyces sp. AmelKG-E11A]|nr:hypothetical protein YW7DRAFT_03740 [Streptomyces sp. AmelKG-E11A]
MTTDDRVRPATERNVRFYESLGFRVTAEITLPDGGPQV